MFAVYAKEANFKDPLASVVIGERPDPLVEDGWVRVKVTHASLNRHDIFTLRGLTAQEQAIPFPMILGNDGAGLLDDRSPVVIYPVMGTDSWKGDETIDPHWHVLSELVPGTMADYVAVLKRNAVPIPDGLSALTASLLGTAWLTAYRTLFTKSRLIPGQTLLVQGASGGMATALIQMGRAAGFEVWVTTRNNDGAAIAERLGANRIFRHGDPLPRRADAVVDNIGAATWSDSLKAVKRGGVLVINGITTGPHRRNRSAAHLRRADRHSRHHHGHARGDERDDAIRHREQHQARSRGGCADDRRARSDPRHDRGPHAGQDRLHAVIAERIRRQQ